MRKKAVVVHSGGMDSSICLATALREWGKDDVLSLSFRYHQRHNRELRAASRICREWGVDHAELSVECLAEITENSLTHHEIAIQHEEGDYPNTLVEGRNGLMARLACIHAKHLDAETIYMGVLGREGANAGYRDCSRHYMDMMEKIMQWDLNLPNLSIRTPVVNMSKCETLELALGLEVLDFLLQETVTCYEGIPHWGCRKCPACGLRNEGIKEFCGKNPSYTLPFSYLNG